MFDDDARRRMPLATVTARIAEFMLASIPVLLRGRHLLMTGRLSRQAGGGLQRFVEG